MAIEITSCGVGAIAVAGEIDATSAPRLADALTDLGANPRIDLSGCTFMDSSGISVLVDNHHEAEAAGGRLTLVAPSNCVTRLLTICGLDDVVHVDTPQPVVDG